MTFNYLVWSLLGPAAWPVWTALLALLSFVLRDRRARRWPLRLAAVSGALTLVLMATPLGYLLIRPLDLRFSPTLPDDAAHIVVLAGAEALRQSTQAGRLEVSAAGERIIEGAALARRYPAARVWIVGGIRGEDDGRADAEWTANAWARLGIAPERIVVVDTTRDTCGNAEAVAAARPVGTMMLVTSAWHMPRSVACFRANGLAVETWPVDYRSWPAKGFADMWSADPSGNLARVDMALHEWVGLALYRAQGRTAELFPN
jgi:uncharacterized SAM-binding protein YcdF (DUF218 family)